MSSKSSQKNKKLSVPRELPDIEKEYQQKSFEAGQLQYQVAIYNEELINANRRIKALNHEAAARKQLNEMSNLAKSQQSAQAAVKEVSNEQQSN